MKPLNLDGMIASKSAAMRAQDAMAATQPNPSEKELQRQHLLIGELFRRLDALAIALTQQKAPVVNVEAAAAPQVTVEAATVNVPPTVVNVEQPDFKIDAPNINVAAPNVTVEAPNVTVNPPQVHVSAPSVSVAAPSVTVQAPSYRGGDVNVPYPKRLSFKHVYDENDNIIETLVTATE